jgi:predicted  nucleic acid-binding Zn-ribbon protein
MAYNPEYSATNPQPTPKRDDRKIIYGILIAALLVTWGYIIYDKSKTNESINQLQTQYSNVDSARNEVQAEYNDALARLDSATGNNTQLTGALAERQSEINNLKKQISSITSKRNATAAELDRARGLINQLNMRIDYMYAEIQKLKYENQQLATTNKRLNTEKQQLNTEKTQLAENLTTTETARKEVEDVASTLHASNLNITPIHVKGNGKEKETTTAKRVDLLRVSFDVDENRVAPTGNKDLYVTVTGPDGRPVTMASESGTFDTRDQGSKPYTNKVTIPYEQGKKSTVSFDWKQEGKYQLGEYRIEVYHNGFKIGEGKKTLKKGGIFG